MFYLRRLFTQELCPVSQSDLLGCLPHSPHQLQLLCGGFAGAPGLDSLTWLHNLAPCFPLRGEQIQVIHEPQHFYQTLMQRSSQAKKRIVLASLYLGTGKLEHSLVQTLRRSLQAESSLRLNVLLDFTRGTRGVANSKTMLLPLLREFGNQVQFSLYHTPDLRGMTKRLAPPRWNELLGLQHMKVYLIDDAVIISGANLSNDYFTNRQDRYILIEDKPLADFYAQFIERVQEFSLAVSADSTEGLHSSWRILPYEGTKEQFIKLAKERITNFVQEAYQRQVQLRATDNSSRKADTWIFPLLEMGQLGIHHDSVVTKQLLSNCIAGSRLKLATGYFNLTQEYMDTITHKCLAQCSILMAHPNANGFQGAKGPAGGIPAAYTLIAKSFYESLVRRQQEHRVNFFEYEQPGWTYHAKGLWYYLPETPLPSLTLIGSSNFGERSVNRDLETQVCLVTDNKDLRQRLQAEADRLYDKSTTAERQIVQRQVPRWVQAVVRIFRNFF
ncbi:CDP-diacylglycerol--glycerol-3-phosphate 3-phosphatidyltransferase, mitochondrial [Drosophila sulfurigaster albostrigata]|uniref:CDP-diacylglycerol--glycerol-3-phosphate 3-phosphatidyltransferase, mitochondrial n=1 Tax=Drosophila sulfurigaster albostrigata TaxID=89887 RepID=UPI002D218D28|nr:CDP-diacylglycerol--glycerol-3-phosphate 3-phosphatidyltransferase, mitochondrial [Drosophila sulfurigaster albostrigata]